MNPSQEDAIDLPDRAAAAVVGGEVISEEVKVLDSGAILPQHTPEASSQAPIHPFFSNKPIHMVLSRNDARRKAERLLSSSADELIRDHLHLSPRRQIVLLSSVLLLIVTKIKRANALALILARNLCALRLRSA